jgi:hypothetical protein
MKGWKTRLLALVTVMALLTSIAGPAIADRGDDCRRFHGDRYCEVDRGDRGDHKFRNDDFDNYYIFYPFYYPYFFPYYSYGYNDCGFDRGGPVNPYDCWA